MTLPCCTIDGDYFQPFTLEGGDAERWISPAGPGLKRIEFIVPQANRPDAMGHIETDLGKTLDQGFGGQTTQVRDVHPRNDISAKDYSSGRARLDRGRPARAS